MLRATLVRGCVRSAPEYCAESLADGSKRSPMEQVKVSTWGSGQTSVEIAQGTGIVWSAQSARLTVARRCFRNMSEEVSAPIDRLSDNTKAFANPLARLRRNTTAGRGSLLGNTG